MNDVFAITVCPSFEHPEKLAARIKESMPKDLKSISSVSDKAIELIRDERFFHFVFVVEGRHRMFGEQSEGLAKARIFCEETVGFMKAIHARRENVKPFNILLQKSKEKLFNVKLLSDMVLFSSMVSSINCMLVNSVGAELIGVFPDRDSITQWCDSVYSKFVDNYSAGVLWLVEQSPFHCVIKRGVPSGQEVKKNWYDDFVRLPDYMAGVVATWDIRSGEVGGGKHQVLFMENIVGASNASILRIGFDGRDMHLDNVSVSV